MKCVKWIRMVHAVQGIRCRRILLNHIKNDNQYLDLCDRFDIFTVELIQYLAQILKGKMKIRLKMVSNVFV